MINNFITVRCPKCGREYTLAEIFYPSDLLGEPNNIIREDDGKIMLIEGDRPSYQQEYECDNCGTVFTTRVELTADTIKSKPDITEDDDDDEFTIDLGDKDKEQLF